MSLRRVTARNLIAGDRVTLTPGRSSSEHTVERVDVVRDGTVEVTFVGMGLTDPPEHYMRDEIVFVRVNADDVARRLRTVADVLSDDDDADRQADVYALLAAARAIVGQA